MRVATNQASWKTRSWCTPKARKQINRPLRRSVGLRSISWEAHSLPEDTFVQRNNLVKAPKAHSQSAIWHAIFYARELWRRNNSRVAELDVATARFTAIFEKGRPRAKCLLVQLPPTPHTHTLHCHITRNDVSHNAQLWVYNRAVSCKFGRTSFRSNLIWAAVCCKTSWGGVGVGGGGGGGGGWKDLLWGLSWLCQCRFPWRSVTLCAPCLVGPSNHPQSLF